MSKFVVSRAARTDLKNIAAFTQKNWGASQRRIYLKGIDSTFHYLAENPLNGNQCNYISEGLRKLRYESHVIFYEKNDNKNEILIVRVLHKSMDYELNLGST